MTKAIVYSLAALVAVAAFTQTPVRPEVFDAWSSRRGKVQVVGKGNGESYLVCRGRRIAEFPTRGFLFASFRPSGDLGDEVFLIQLNAADTAWFHILEVREKGDIWVSPRIGNGGDLPKVVFKAGCLELLFEELDYPRGIVPAQSWQFQGHQLVKIR
ncbi:hypothetical protein [Mesoterricola sediminis]|uniref:hypothetical protein n=1 Tax=Mesoterricola sediminis TaxID=2927980 RepID=UPI00292E8E64|nr:hypothetical protein [Mesoterricola sediminis]